MTSLAHKIELALPGATIELPYGTSVVERTIKVPAGVKIVGKGVGRTYIEMRGEGPVFHLTANTGTGCQLMDFGIINEGSEDNIGILIETNRENRSPDWALLRNLYITASEEHRWKHCISIDGSARTIGVRDITLENVYCFACHDSIANFVKVNNLHAVNFNCFPANGLTNHIDLERCSNVVLSSCYLDRVVNHGSKLVSITSPNIPKKTLFQKILDIF